MDAKSFFLGCGIAVAVALLMLAGCVGFMVYVAEDPKDISAVVEAPAEVKVGEKFELHVLVTNRRAKDAMMLSDIDLGDTYLAGFEVVGTNPKAKSTMHVPIDESQSYTFATKIAPGTSRKFTFRLQAKSAGVYQGDVDVCEGLRFLTLHAQTRVQE